jgi:hypothetical protein
MKRSLERWDYGILGKGRTVVKVFQINHPTNASIGSHSGNSPSEPT